MADIVYHPPKALERLILHFKGKHGTIAKACRLISKKLNYEWGESYIYQISKGMKPATDKFRQMISQLNYKTFNPSRHWLNIHALTLEQKERWKEIPMDKRRKALDIMFLKVRKDIKCEHECTFVHPYGWVPEEGCPIHDQLEEEKKGQND